MFDREVVNTPYQAPKTPGRNEKVTIEKDGNTMELKYKKTNKYLEDGWILSEA